MDRGRLAAWVDGKRDAEVAAHVAACSVCAAAAAEMRQHRERLRRYRAATTPPALPPAVWSAVCAGLDKQDKQRQARQTVRRTIPRTAVPATFAAALFSLGLCFSLFVLPRLRPAAVPVAALLSRPAASAPPGPTLSTGDADAAARWLSQQLGQEVPVVSLALADAPLVNAQADARKGAGVLLFHSAAGVPLALHIFLHARLAPSQTSAVSYSAVSYRGSIYQVVTGPRTLNTLVLWQSGGQTFAAIAPLPPQQILPYVHEMSRRCLPGH